MLTKHIGDVGEAACLTRLLMLGYKVLIPFGEGHDFDLVYYTNKKFIRAQVKVGWPEGPSLCFGSRKRSKSKYDVDVFLVWFDGRIFSVPIKDCNICRTYLNLGKGKQSHKIRLFAKDYELLPKDKRWLDSIKRE